METVDLSAKRYLFPPMHREGRRFVFIAALIALLASHAIPALTFIFILLPFYVYYFFRDPERVPPTDPNLIVSPADGIICLVQKVSIPKELGAHTTPVWRISVFMSVFNVHVNRMPATGTITKTHYIPGKFLNASLDKASEFNERHLYLMETSQKQTLAFVQIAGLVARRILSFVVEGQKLERSQRFGLIRFGSRVDVYLPEGIEPQVRVGQIMVAGETPLARI